MEGGCSLCGMVGGVNTQRLIGSPISPLRPPTSHQDRQDTLDPTDRAAQLHTTGSLRGFQVDYACHTSDLEAIEQSMYVAFGPRRGNERLEFFEIESEQVIAVLSLYHHVESSTTTQ